MFFWQYAHGLRGYQTCRATGLCFDKISLELSLQLALFTTEMEPNWVSLIHAGLKDQVLVRFLSK